MSKVLLVILDGWGHSDFAAPPSPGNAVEQAEVPVFRALVDGRPHTRLACSGVDVGLPEGQMGNSEVGHLNLGAGRIVDQDIRRVDRAVEEGTLGELLGLPELLPRLRETGAALHLVGLVSDGGVHSHIRHLHAILDLLPPDLDVRIHVITDGRDTSPTSGAGFVEEIAERCREAPGWTIATVVGRYFAMDRDARWDRTEKAFRAIVEGRAPRIEDAPDFLPDLYEEGTTDEFVPPTVIAGAGEEGMDTDDAVIFFNFRADRMRQICSAVRKEELDGFERGDCAVPADITTFSRYEEGMSARVLLAPKEVDDCLSEVLARAGKRQLRVAETEKYAHVTYFFNGGVEEPYEGEARELIPSPKVATYDLQPEMSAEGVAEAVLAGMRSGEPDFVLVNFANPDMVGHTGVIPAAVAAVEAVDGELGRLLAAVDELDDWVALVTADHGNCEKMLTEDGRPHTAHTTEPVDFFLYDPRRPGAALRDGGRLADVAPTVLVALGMEVPAAMTGTPLVEAR